MTTATAPPPVTDAPVQSTKDWVITLLISFIPVVGFVMLFVWAFGSNENPNKANWAKATLIWYAIGCVLLFLFGSMFLAFIMAATGSGGGDGF
jgi:heme/copper-type cytochrome/quinol oxidase subunit 2